MRTFPEPELIFSMRVARGVTVYAAAYRVGDSLALNFEMGRSDSFSAPQMVFWQKDGLVFFLDTPEGCAAAGLFALNTLESFRCDIQHTDDEEDDDGGVLFPVR